MIKPKLLPYNHTPAAYRGPSYEQVKNLRAQYMDPAIFTFYQKPIMLVEGSMQNLYNKTGRRYLDGIGDIVTISVGHATPM